MLFMLLFLATTLCEWQTTLGNSTTLGNPDFISIDCGASSDFSDEEISLEFKTDKEFIDTGINADMPKDFVNPYNKQGQTLRSFPNGTRNCYTLNPGKGRNNKYLIRASFLYGNYDGKNNVPIFDLFLANEKWMTVNIGSSTMYKHYEIIYVPLSDYVDVCLHKTGSGVPFISELALRQMDYDMYETKEGWLFEEVRLNMGASNALRYPNDKYDRIWEPPKASIIPGWRLYNAASISNKLSTNKFNLPVQVMSSAITSENATTPLEFKFLVEDTTAKYAFYFHFVGIQNILQGRKKKLNISINNDFINEIEIGYLETFTLYTVPKSVTNQNNIISIRSADNSSLPPFINAFEAFRLIRIEESSSAPDDVSAVKGIKKRYNVTRDTWQGDPCTPKNFKWEGLDCSYNDSIRVIAINLGWSNLKDEIDLLFGTLSALESLDLSHNELSGQIPEFLASLPKLVHLNLTGNNLSGPIPKALLDKSRVGSLQLSLDENPGLCEDECLMQVTTKKNKTNKSFVVPVVVAVVSALVLLLLISVVVLQRKRKRKHKVPSVNTRRQLSVASPKFSYSEVKNITDNFSTRIAGGGFGEVYHGKLDDDREVAVKMLSPESEQGDSQFQAEAKVLLSVNHKNLVSLIGYCDEQEHKGLIYEYMPKGNLQECLSGANVLTWTERLKIAIDCAQGVEYLHKLCTKPITHRDLKTSNILLDEKLNAKVADFGLSKPCRSNVETSQCTLSAGTMGYLDPECQNTGNFTEKSDVYSFGIVLLELISGHSAIIKGPPNVHIVQWVNPLADKGDIDNIVDKRLQENFDSMSARKAVEVALLCTEPIAKKRPDISRVLKELKECLNVCMMTRKRSSMDLEDSMSSPP